MWLNLLFILLYETISITSPVSVMSEQGFKEYLFAF